MSDSSIAAGPVRIGVLGAGRIGRMHCELLTRSVAGAEVAMVYDAVGSVAAGVGAELGIPVAGGVEEVFASAEVDAVAICSSTNTHVELLLAASKAGKAVFCEKPLALDLAEVDRALRAVNVAGIPLMVGFNRRFDPSHRAVRDAVVSGRIGDPHLVRITSRDPAPPPEAYVRSSGGIFLDMTIHDFDMARFVTGSEVEEVYATGGVRVDEMFARAGDIDTAVVVLRHANGCITTIDNSRRAVYGYDQRVEAFGPGGLAASENPLVRTTVLRGPEGTQLAEMPTFFLDRYTTSYIKEWEAFVEAVATRSPMPVTGLDGRAPLVIGQAALLSLKERRPVSVGEVAPQFEE
jgi:myo-inositol 2-dehydrogenase/D-chiro-inositol 1-dehydrogenase